MRYPIIALAALAALSSVASADSLDDQPAVRHKYELRQKRIEIAPTFEATVNAPYKHTLSIGAKAEYHLSDVLSVGALVFFSPFDASTGLYSEIWSSLPNPSNNVYPTPNQYMADTHVNTMPIHGGLGATVTPWFGKMAVFGGRGFLAYDIYLSGGFGFAVTKNTFSGDDNLVMCDNNCGTSGEVFNDPRNDGPHNAGFNPGVQLGAGMHFYVNRWIAVDVSVRDYFFLDNPSGLDSNFDLRVSSDDRSFTGHLFVGLGASILLPQTVKVSK